MYLRGLQASVQERWNELIQGQRAWGKSAGLACADHWHAAALVAAQTYPSSTSRPLLKETLLSSTL